MKNPVAIAHFSNWREMDDSRRYEDGTYLVFLLDPLSVNFLINQIFFLHTATCRVDVQTAFIGVIVHVSRFLLLEWVYRSLCQWQVKKISLHTLIRFYVYCKVIISTFGYTLLRNFSKSVRSEFNSHFPFQIEGIIVRVQQN